MKNYHSSTLILSFTLLFAAACDDEKPTPPPSGGCQASTECDPGWVCASGECIKVCVSQSDCPSGQICMSDRCQDIEPGLSPEITTVTGNDLTDAAQVIDGLRVTGSRLEAATFELQGDTTVALAVRSQTDTEVELVFPPDILSGSYLLVATNAAGSDQEPIQLNLPDLTGDMIVTKINEPATTGRIALDRLAEPVQPLLTGDATVALINDAGTTGRIQLDRLAEAVQSPLTGDDTITMINDATTTERINLDRLAEQVQVRVATGCPAGQSIRAINADGSVVCEVHMTTLDVQDIVDGEIAASWDMDLDGRIDARALPAGLYNNRILDGRTISFSQSGFDSQVRNLTFLKTDPSSVVEITSFDSGGAHMSGVHAPSYSFIFSVDELVAGLGAGHQSTDSTGWRMWPRLHRYYVDDLPAGLHELELEHSGEYADGYYYAWSGSNHIEVREIPATEARAITRFSSDQRNTDTSYVPVADRSLAYTKQGDASVPMLITIQDTWGSRANAATGGPGCTWQLYVDGAPPAREVGLYHNNDDGWMIYPATLGWLVEGLDAGAHTFDLYVKMEVRSAECLNGWSSWGHVNARELDPSRVAYVADLDDVQNGGAWQIAPGRTVVYDKLDDGSTSDLRILWMDNLGFTQAAAEPACAYRVVMDGDQVNPVAETREHASATPVWRLQPHMSEFIVEDVAAGSHTFALEWQAESGATSCRNGWSPTADSAANFLLIMETAR